MIRAGVPGRPGFLIEPIDPECLCLRQIPRKPCTHGTFSFFSSCTPAVTVAVLGSAMGFRHSLNSLLLGHLLSNSCLLSLTSISMQAMDKSISWMHLCLAAGNYNLSLCDALIGQGVGSRALKLIFELRSFSCKSYSPQNSSPSMAFG